LKSRFKSNNFGQHPGARWRIDSQNRRRRARRPGAPRKRLARLSPGERAVLNLLLEGKMNKEIAPNLASAPAPLRTGRAKLMKKMGAKSLAELIQLVMTH